MGTQLNLVGSIASEIDRLVIRGHELAAEYPDKPAAMTELKAYPQLLSTAAVVLLDRPLTRTEILAILPYTPSTLIEQLIDNNVAEGVVSDDAGTLSLTTSGRAAAEGVVAVQDAAVGEAWSAAAADLEAADRLFVKVVAHGSTLEPPAEPSTFLLFSAVCERPTLAARVLRLMTAVRYWRADAHRRVIADAGFRSNEAHALNRLWDAHRGVERVGQGYPDPGRKGVASLELRGLAGAGSITAEGIALRERIEAETNRLTAQIYEPLEDGSQERLLAALESLPA